jgi:flagellar biosynthesis/type III secretory pathway M-ring protein FliF/YscJ
MRLYRILLKLKKKISNRSLLWISLNITYKEFNALKKILITILCISILMIMSACQKEYDGEYIQWGDSEKTVDTNKLEENNIPYKIESGRVYIPEDAFDKAIYCCS